MNQYHYVQLAILKKLLFSDGLNFSALRPTAEMENNQLVFHIEQLLKDKLVVKDNKIYRLTNKGKEYANRIDSTTDKVEKQGKISTIQCCFREVDNSFEFLIYTRLKHPFYGSQGYPSGKVPFGSSTKESSQRELNEETNLDGEGELFMIEHHRVYDKKTENLMEDKYFYFYKYKNPTGELKPNDEGDFEWVKESELEAYFRKPFESVERLMYITERIKGNEALTFEEITHFADNF